MDAFAPRTGQSAFDVLPWLREAFTPGPDGPPWAVPPLPFADLGVSDPGDQAWLAEDAAVRGFRVVTLPECGHFPMVTHPDVLAAELLATTQS